MASDRIETNDGLSFLAPRGFACEESVVTLRAPLAPVEESRILKKKMPVRANLVVRRRMVQAGATIEQLAGEMCGELVKTIAGLDGLETAVFKFTDGVEGLLIGYRFPAAESIVLRQYHALRLDGERMTTMTITADDEAITEGERDHYFTCLASAQVKP